MKTKQIFCQNDTLRLKNSKIGSKHLNSITLIVNHCIIFTWEYFCHCFCSLREVFSEKSATACLEKKYEADSLWGLANGRHCSWKCTCLARRQSGQWPLFLVLFGQLRLLTESIVNVGSFMTKKVLKPKVKQRHELSSNTDLNKYFGKVSNCCHGILFETLFKLDLFGFSGKHH